MSERLPDGWEKRYVSLDHVDASEPPWIIPGILPIGLTLIEGPGRMYKTTFAMELAACIAKGREVLDTKATRPGLVIFACKEQNPSTLKFKATPAGWWTAPREGIRVASVLCPKNVWHWRLDSFADASEMYSDIKEFSPSLAAVVLDPWARFLVGDENDKRIIHQACDPLYALAHTLGIAIVIIHHTRKLAEGATPTRESARGSSALPYMMDGVLLFEGISEDGTVTIKGDFRDHEPSELLWVPVISQR